MWRKSQIVNDYVTAAREAILERDGQIEESGKIEAWSSWVEQVAQSIDPLREIRSPRERPNPKSDCVRFSYHGPFLRQFYSHVSLYDSVVLWQGKHSVLAFEGQNPSRPSLKLNSSEMASSRGTAEFDAGAINLVTSSRHTTTRNHSSRSAIILYCRSSAVAAR